MPDRTIVYVDGFNLYYRALKGTKYKWLDLYKLAENLFPPEKNDILKIKFFTTRIKGRSNNQDSQIRQDVYLRALKAYHPDKIDIYYGTFLSHTALRPNDPIGTGWSRVILTEEKGTDVNLAVHLLNDAWLDLYDCAVVVSNDSDLAEAMRMAKARGKRIGWVVPGKDYISQVLKKIVDFKLLLLPNILASSQLPYQIPETKIIKPQAWSIGKE